MTRKEDKDVIHTGVPEDAVEVKEIGPWAVLFSKADMSLYFRSSSVSPSALRLSRDDLLLLAQEMEGWRLIKKKPVAPESRTKEAQPSRSSRDKRRFRRFTRRCEAEFTAREITHRGIASDFSISGLFIRTNHPFPADTDIDILVHLPDGSVSALHGKVKRAMKNSLGSVMGIPMNEYKNGMGVELVEKDANYLHFIRSLIK